MSTSIEWCDETWNPIVGCSRVSAGCDNCYAMSVAHRKMTPSHVGLTVHRPKDASRPGVDWNGTVRCMPERLSEPMRWRKPRRVFVNSMSDLFHPSVTREFIAAVFGVMAACPQHTYLVLTKRPKLAVNFFQWLDATVDGDPPWAECTWQATSMLGRSVDDPLPTIKSWPLPNVHLGVSTEDQGTFDERVPPLLDCPAAVRWISAEPLLGPIEMRSPIRWEDSGSEHQICYPPHHLDWVVVGGESGHGARPCGTEWIRSIVHQCKGATVPVFVKQLGARPLIKRDGAFEALPISDAKGKDPTEWPEDLRVRELPEVCR